MESFKEQNYSSEISSIDWDDILRPKLSIVSRRSPSESSKQGILKRVPCRYGRGCTHIHDPVHQERFIHPAIPALDPEQIRNHYMCNECGMAFVSLQELQIHLQRKTAWSNQSLLGCRISCLIDNKEWHEGIVTHYHRSGKHSVEFRSIGEKRWLNMTKMAFYIIEHGPQDSTTEFKENDDGESSGFSCSEYEEWNYVEDLSLDYAFAQSVLFKIYGGVIQETGHKTRGHTSLTEDDRENAKNAKGSLLYGELLPRGVNKALGPQHLKAATKSVLFDLGMGTGKILIQAFLQFRNLKYVYGIELSLGRYMIAQESAIRMINLLGKDSFEVKICQGSSIIVTEKPHEGQDHERVLHMECGNMMAIKHIEKADIIMLETDIPQELQGDLCVLLNQMHDGAKTLTYHDIRKIWTLGQFPYKQLEVNRYLTDRFPTSWSVQRGHHFFLWKKMSPSHISASGRGDNTDASSSALVSSCSSIGDYRGSKSSARRDNICTDDSDCEIQHAGCLPSFFSVFKYLRRRSVADKESDKVIPVNHATSVKKSSSRSSKKSLRTHTSATMGVTTKAGNTASVLTVKSVVVNGVSDKSAQKVQQTTVETSSEGYASAIHTSANHTPSSPSSSNGSPAGVQSPRVEGESDSWKRKDNSNASSPRWEHENSDLYRNAHCSLSDET
mmetsp:Transcript_1814/g.2865  ORF Transcript_1814/g.2865 Transcript_1814/m.2865 type:complete len:670 (-) Transcript_1814:217-2226(-)|eukprot:CAMPEP_0185033570 /NCGR_PEP_ID=MMETSP1103-20130426/22630_1 /TAXON_ID=36769 /ORGANISM="Paraphysomonas bandaiensis, Strain Caron Lab Isolate" /LENGTH=669 /DNA_ID=CAMNT_0027569885 /DNA_START=109 /DNA_END=2118 /DNA_ORIENTATION=-